MTKRLFVAFVIACALAAVRCSQSPDVPTAPSAVGASGGALNPDGSTLKISAPAALSPSGVTVDTRRPTLSFSNATGRYAAVGLIYELEVSSGGAVV